ncbi:uncharacterized protein BDZ99DRAFT_102399 [Mytilinidion resinicola]|uniref:MFS general substrate transporter n=1 Tax=Mytilinidion resinicola TaxID=574789 RepID=A0A6A6YBR5_9PEZI|nr:uncharacterized protein BDZ99DRAFT_102399 [Mytilinidion resinicola]KAF2806018.1 hypothetical protein BDZ99DRAFT_102399 [Mytilinidion resinicola]
MRAALIRPVDRPNGPNNNTPVYGGPLLHIHHRLRAEHQPSNADRISFHCKLLWGSAYGNRRWCSLRFVCIWKAEEINALATDEKTTFLKTVRSNWNAHHASRTLKRSVTILVVITRHLPALVILILIGIFNGLVNMILSTLGSVFQFQYHFPPATAGLSYLGLRIGGMVGLAVTPHLSDSSVNFDRIRTGRSAHNMRFQ